MLAPTPKHHVQHVYAGGDTCFVLSSATQPTEDMRIQNAREAILKLDENRLEEMTSFLEKQRPPLSKLRSEKFTNKFIDIMSFFCEFYPLNQTIVLDIYAFYTVMRWKDTCPNFCPFFVAVLRF